MIGLVSQQDDNGCCVEKSRAGTKVGGDPRGGGGGGGRRGARQSHLAGGGGRGRGCQMRKTFKERSKRWLKPVMDRRASCDPVWANENESPGWSDTLLLRRSMMSTWGPGTE